MGCCVLYESALLELAELMHECSTGPKEAQTTRGPSGDSASRDHSGILL